MRQVCTLIVKRKRDTRKEKAVDAMKENLLFCHSTVNTIKIHTNILKR